MEEKYKLLEQIHHDAAMAVYTIESLLKDLEEKDNKIKEYLYETKEEYKEYEQEAEEILTTCNIEPKEPGMFSKMGSSMGVKKEVAMDNSDSAIADMMIQGVSMGSIEIEKKLKEYEKELDADHKRLARKYLKFQQKTIEHLKKYL